jgi:hypothetical protein
MTADEPQGCLLSLLRLFGLGGSVSVPSRLSYRLADGLLTPAELAFYRVLRGLVSENSLICPKVRLSDVFVVPRGDGRQAAMNRINQKHVDFLLCDPETLQPVLAIELDDASHERKKRQDRDATVDEIFAAAGLPLVHVRAAAAYSPQDLRRLIEQAGEAAPIPAVTTAVPSKSSDQPVCRRCGSQMILRTAKKGSATGSQFWGCPNYPQCRETLPME